MTKFYVAAANSEANCGAFKTARGCSLDSFEKAVGAAMMLAHMDMKEAHPEKRSPKSPVLKEKKVWNNYARLTFSTPSKDYEDVVYYIDGQDRRWDAFSKETWPTVLGILDL